MIEGEVGIRVGGQVFRAPAGAYVIKCRDANGRHQRILGPAHVKDSGRRTPSRAVVWRAADGPRPGPDWLTPDDAAAALRVLLAESRGRFAVRHGHEDGEVTLGGRPWHRRRQWTDLAAGFPV